MNNSNNSLVCFGNEIGLRKNGRRALEVAQTNEIEFVDINFV